MSSRLLPVCPAATVDASCPAANILIAPHATIDTGSGLYAEPLQVPTFGTRPNGYFPHYDLPDPSSWDRSPLPTGACVFRVHGMGAECVRNGILFEGECPAPGFPGAAPASFYDGPYCGQSVVPGCPISDPWGDEGNWWYLQPDGANVDLVICAPECATDGIDSDGACLSLSPPTP
jgi:hypothetical protein